MAAKALIALGLTAVLSACGTEDTGSQGPEATAGSASDSSAAGSPTGTSGDPIESDQATARLAVSHPDGVLVLDAATLEVVADLPAATIKRLDPLGDNRHMAVAGEDGFALLDMGTWGESHDDHGHYYTAAPEIRGGWLPAGKPGHVVVHDGRTVIFDDSTGAMLHGKMEDLGRAIGDGNPQQAFKRIESEHAHHGVGVGLADGTILSTLGDEKTRVGVIARDATGRETARSERCPDVHGEAAAADAVGFGCTGAVVVYRDRGFRAVATPDPKGRITTLSGHPTSPVLFGNYSTKDADDAGDKAERKYQISFVDTDASTMRVVEVPADYSFRSFGRDPDGGALLLGTDGVLRVFDAATGTQSAEYPVIDPWEVPEDWKEPRPALFVAGATAYVSEPATRSVLAVDLKDGSEIKRAEIPAIPIEIDGVSGDSPSGH